MHPIWETTAAIVGNWESEKILLLLLGNLLQVDARPQLHRISFPFWSPEDFRWQFWTRIWMSSYRLLNTTILFISWAWKILLVLSCQLCHIVAEKAVFAMKETLVFFLNVTTRFCASSTRFEMFGFNFSFSLHMSRGMRCRGTEKRDVEWIQTLYCTRHIANPEEFQNCSICHVWAICSLELLTNSKTCLDYSQCTTAMCEIQKQMMVF